MIACLDMETTKQIKKKKNDGMMRGERLKRKHTLNSTRLTGYHKALVGIAARAVHVVHDLPCGVGAGDEGN